jgi:hypothetical protein
MSNERSSHRRLRVMHAVAVLVMSATACDQSDDARTVSVPRDTTAQVSDAIAVSDSGIGHVNRSMTLAELRAALPAGVALGSAADFMVDISGIPVIERTDTLYYLLFTSDVEIGDTTHVQLLTTSHARAQTPQGITPGMTLGEVAAIVGPLTLSYNVNDEAREYVSFAAKPPDMFFRVRTPETGSFAGVYPEISGESNTTTRYDPDARILMIMVSLPARTP